MLREAVHLDGRHGMVERPPQIDRKRLICLFVEAELLDGTRLLPARVVVVLRSLVEAELHVVMGSEPFAGVDDTALHRAVNIRARYEDRRAARSGVHLAAEARANTHSEPLVVTDRSDLLSEPTGHLRWDQRAWARHEIEGGVRLLPEFEPVALVVPAGHALAVHPERDGIEPLDCGFLRGPIGRGSHEGLDGALRRRIEAAERRHDLAAWEHLDPKSAAAHLLDEFRQPLRRALVRFERRWPCRRHPPVDLWLRNEAGG